MKPALTVLTVLTLLVALSLVAWRQSRAREALAALEGVRQERLLAEAERSRLDVRIRYLESRPRVVPEARTRLGMHLPDEATEIVILAGDSF